MKLSDSFMKITPSNNNSSHDEYSQYKKIIASNIQIHKDEMLPLLYIVNNKSIVVINEKEYKFLYNISLQQPAKINTTCGCYCNNVFCLLSIGNNNTFYLYIPSKQNNSIYTFAILNITNIELLKQNEEVVKIQNIKNNYVPYFILYTSYDQIMFLSITKSRDTYIGTFEQYQNTISVRGSFFSSIIQFQNPLKSIYNHFYSNNSTNDNIVNDSSCFILNPFSYTSLELNTNIKSVLVLTETSLRKFNIEFNDNINPMLVYENNTINETILEKMRIKSNSLNIIASDVTIENNEEIILIFCIIKILDRKYFLIRIELNNNNDINITYIDITENVDGEDIPHIEIYLNKMKKQQEGIISVIYKDYMNLIFFTETDKYFCRYNIEYQYGYPIIDFNQFSYNVFSSHYIKTIDINQLQLFKQNETPNFKYMKAFQTSMTLSNQKDLSVFQTSNNNFSNNSSIQHDDHRYIINDNNLINNDLLNQLIHLHLMYLNSNEITSDIINQYNIINSNINANNENTFYQSILQFIDMKKEHHVPNVEILKHSSTKAEKIIIEYLNEKEHFFQTLLILLYNLNFFQNLHNPSRLSVFNSLFLSLESITISKQIRILEDNNPLQLNYNYPSQSKHSFFCNLFNMTESFISSFLSSLTSPILLFTFITNVNNSLHNIYSYINFNMDFFINTKGSTWCLNNNMLNGKLPSIFLTHSNSNMNALSVNMYFDYVESLFKLLQAYYINHKSSHHNTRYYNIKKEMCAVLQKKNDEKCLNEIALKYNEYYSVCSITFNNKEKYLKRFIEELNGKDEEVKIFMLKLMLQLELERIERGKGRKRMVRFEFFDDFGMEFEKEIEVIVRPYDYLRKLFELYVNQKNEAKGRVEVEEIVWNEEGQRLKERNLILLALSEKLEKLVNCNSDVYKKIENEDEDVEMDI